MDCKIRYSSYVVKCRLLLCLLAITIASFVLLFSTTARAEGNILYTSPTTGYSVAMDDSADLITDSEESSLALEMQDITQYGNAMFATIPEDNNGSTSYIATKEYDSLFAGTSGTIFLIDMGTREIYIFSDGAMYNTITSAKAEMITDNVYSYASRSDYYTCASKAFEQVIATLEGDKVAAPMKTLSTLLLSLIIALIIMYIVATMSCISKHTTATEFLTGVKMTKKFDNAELILDSTSRVRNSSSGGGHGGGGGGHGGGGGGHSGGGGGHSF